MKSTAAWGLAVAMWLMGCGPPAQRPTGSSDHPGDPDARPFPSSDVWQQNQRVIPANPFSRACDAAYNGNVAELTKILDADPTLARQATNSGAVLHYAANAAIVDLLIARGADIEAIDSDGQTALHRKGEYGNVEVARALLAHGAKVDVGADQDLGTPLYLSVVGRQYSPEMMELLRKHTQSLDLRTAIVLFEHDTVQALLQADPEAIRKSRWRDNLINIAVLEATFRELRAEGEQPLDLPRIQQGHREMIELLVQAGAPINAHGTFQRSPLHWAAYCASRPLASALLAQGADLADRAEDGGTPIEHARDPAFRAWLSAQPKR